MSTNARYDFKGGFLFYNYSSIAGESDKSSVNYSKPITSIAVIEDGSVIRPTRKIETSIYIAKETT